MICEDFQRDLKHARADPQNRGAGRKQKECFDFPKSISILADLRRLSTPSADSEPIKVLDLSCTLMHLPLSGRLDLSTPFRQDAARLTFDRISNYQRLNGHCLCTRLVRAQTRPTSGVPSSTRGRRTVPLVRFGACRAPLGAQVFSEIRRPRTPIRGGPGGH